MAKFSAIKKGKAPTIQKFQHHLKVGLVKRMQ